MVFEGRASNKIKSLYWEQQRKMGCKTPPRTALDDLGSILNKEREGEAKSSFSKEDEADSDEDMADLVFRKAILPGRTGDFDKDFPPSPKVAKGGKGKLKKSSEKVWPNQCLYQKVMGIPSIRQKVLILMTMNVLLPQKVIPYILVLGDYLT